MQTIPLLRSPRSLGFVLGLIALSRIDAATLGPERWEQAIAAFEAAPEDSIPREGGTLFVGSSSIRMWKTLEKDFPRYQVINRGFGGSQIADSIHYADRIIHRHRPKTVVVYAGDNDIAAGKSPETVLQDFKRLVEVIHADLPRSRIVFIAIKPSISRWKLAPQMERANQMIRSYARLKRRVVYADIWKPMLSPDGLPRPELFVEDGLHLNAQGYELWTKIVAKRLPRP